VITLVYETHSMTTDNEAGIATGWNEGHLSEAGRGFAKALGERRRDDGIAVVYTSDLRRAVETAQIAFSGSGVPVLEDRRLRECNYGELNGRPVPELDAVRLDHVDEPFPGGESYRDVVERTRSFLGDLPEELDGARIVLIAHSANHWALEYLLEGRDLHELVASPREWQEGWSYRLDPGQFGRG
jgi:broad specificity phosphatase PhoE